MGSYFFLLLLLLWGRAASRSFLTFLSRSFFFIFEWGWEVKGGGQATGCRFVSFSLAVFASRFWFFPSLWLYASLVRSHRCLLLAGFTSRIFFSFFFEFAGHVPPNLIFCFRCFPKATEENSQTLTCITVHTCLDIRSWKKPLGYISPTGSVYYLTLYVGDQIFPPPCSAKAWKSHWPMHVSKRSPRFS